MGKKPRPKKPISSDKQREYEQVIAKVNELYIDNYFPRKEGETIEPVRDDDYDQESEVGGEDAENLIDEELVRLSQSVVPEDGVNDTEDNSFEILSTIRYDPLLADVSTFDIGSLFNFAPVETVDDDLSLDTLKGIPLNNIDGEFVEFLNEVNEVNESNDYYSNMFFLFEEHLHRLNFTLQYFKIPFELDRIELLKHLNMAISGLDRSQPYKLRLTVSKKGDVKITSHPTSQRFNLFDGLTLNSIDDYILGGSTVWSVHIDKKPTLISPFTSFKTTRRQHYNQARERVLPNPVPEGEFHEVLIYNNARQVMEGSITSIAFRLFDETILDYDWFTPSLACGCLCGVTRHMLLCKGYIKEKTIHLKDIKIGSEVLLMNGIIGCVKGRIVG